MNKKLLLVLLLVAVLCLSLAVVGCKTTDTPQEQTPQDGGEVIENPNEGENDPPSGEVEYYEDRVLVVLEHQASIDSLALDSLLDLNWGEEVVEVKPRYLYRDEVVKRHIANGELEDQKVVDYQRSLYLTLADSNDGRVDELTAQLPLREDVLTAEKVPVIVSKMISLEEQQQDALQGLSFETRTYTLSNEFADNVVCVALTDTASRAYFNGEDIDWGFKYESVRTYGLSEDDLLKGVYVSFSFVLPIHDKQYILDLVDDLRSRQYVAYALPDVIIEVAVY